LTAVSDTVYLLSMPELPELEVVREVLVRRVVGQTIVGADVIPPGGPIVVRDLTGRGFAAAVAGAAIAAVDRRGKFLLFTTSAWPRPTSS
jgi:formamidopyrimidine-DNA glycosylase